MELTLTRMSEGKVLRYGQKLSLIDGKKMPTKVNGKMIQAACLHMPEDIYFENRSLFPSHLPGGDIAGGDEVSFNLISNLGAKTFTARYNHDRDIATIKVK